MTEHVEWIDKPLAKEDFEKAGWWGRFAARLMKERDESRARVAELEAEIETAKDEAAIDIPNARNLALIGVIRAYAYKCRK